MNAPRQDLFTQRHKKICAARDCPNPGVYCMAILYLGRNGWFCEHCKNNLVADGLIMEQLKDPISSGSSLR